ncbi:hypothetical protein HDE_14176 [Halotydeus destructor]|nr:hypothetical protein HDE_14176 [Halotydeus destructor]
MTSTIVSPPENLNEEKPVDREKSCPLLLRVFLANGPASQFERIWSRKVSGQRVADLYLARRYPFRVDQPGKGS